MRKYVALALIVSMAFLAIATSTCCKKALKTSTAKTAVVDTTKKAADTAKAVPATPAVKPATK